MSKLTNKQRVGTSKLMCPRCRSRSFVLTETTEALMDFVVVNGRCEDMDTNRGSDFGAIVGVWARCSQCPHSWRPRGAHQMPDVITEEQSNDA